MKIKKVLKYAIEKERKGFICHIILLLVILILISSIIYGNCKYDLNSFNANSGPIVVHYCKYNSGLVFHSDQPNILELNKFCSNCGKTFKEEPRGFIYHDYYCNICNKQTIGSYCIHCGNEVVTKDKILLSETPFQNIQRFLIIDTIYCLICLFTIYFIIYTIYNGLVFWYPIYIKLKVYIQLKGENNEKE